MQFVDQVEITIKGGDGGDGIVALRHEKFMPMGGPAGGNGGRGGDVVIQASSQLNTLVDLRYKKNYHAKPGGAGGANDRHGADGDDLFIRVPVGTVIYQEDTGRMIADLIYEGQQCIAAKGGAGGRGNASFASSTNQTPRFAEKGEPVDEIRIRLELKLIADVGIIGYPNVGKSTLISKISAAKPKIADYSFTTLVPNLGVVSVDMRSFVVADMPGLIEGAHEGAGLGDQFLRHIERTRLLVHIIEVSGFSGREPMQDYDAINHELAAYSEKLAGLPQIIALNKVDMPGGREIADELQPSLESRGLEVFEISALTGLGLQPLIYRLLERLDEIPREEAPVEEVARFTVERSEDTWEVERLSSGVFRVVGRPVEVMVGRTDLDNEYGLRRLHRQLDKLGVIRRLRDAGAKHGDTVRIRNLEFDFSDEA
jgi:GTP-binding protein